MLSDSIIAMPGGVKSGLSHTTGGKEALHSLYFVLCPQATNALQVADEAGHSDDGGDTVAFDSAWTPHARAQVCVVLPPFFADDSDDMTDAF